MESMRIWFSMIMRDGKYEVMTYYDYEWLKVWGYDLVWLWGMESMRLCFSMIMSDGKYEFMT